MQTYEIDSPEGLRGLKLGASRGRVRSYFGEGREDILDTPNGVPADYWSGLGVTAFFTANDALLYLAFERDNVTWQGKRLNAMPFSEASAAVQALATDAVASDDLTSADSLQIAVHRDGSTQDHTSATCLFVMDFVDAWTEPHKA